MTFLNALGRRSFLEIAAALGGTSIVRASPSLAGAQDSPEETDAPAITLHDVPFSSGAKVTKERRGQIVLFGINRPYIQNRIDPETFEQLAAPDTPRNGFCARQELARLYKTIRGTICFKWVGARFQIFRHGGIIAKARQTTSPSGRGWSQW